MLIAQEEPSMTRRSLAASLAASLLLLSLVASTAFAARPVFVFSTQLTGEAERPALGDLNAVGHATILIMPETNTVCWAVTWARVDGTVFVAHIHGTASTEVAAPPVVDLFSGSFAGQGSNTGCTVDPDADAIVANPSVYYVNVHSLPSFGPGAIRGQLD
jgi:hypothetical protein